MADVLSICILGGQSSSKRQTVFFLSVDLMDKSHKDPDVIDLNVPRHAQIPAQCIEETSSRSILGRHQSCFAKGLKFYQSRSNAIILQGTLPVSCILKVVRMKTGEVLNEKYTCHLDLRQRSY